MCKVILSGAFVSERCCVKKRLPVSIMTMTLSALLLTHHSDIAKELYGLLVCLLLDNLVLAQETN